MAGYLIPLLIVILGAIAGPFIGMSLRPAEEPAAETEAHGEDPAVAAKKAEEYAAKPSAYTPDQDFSYVQIGRQFVIPIITDGTVEKLVVADLQLEVEPGSSEAAFAREARVRDAFLKVLYRYSHTGAFRQDFTGSHLIEDLRRDLLVAARSVLGDTVNDVLILDLMRQDLT